MLQAKDISVVIQGPVLGSPDSPALEQFTRRSLESVRSALPGAQLILSTWEGANLAGLSADVVVQSADPGAVLHHGSKVAHNVNRQIVSTQAGLAAADRSHVLKIRSDTVLLGDNILCYAGRHRDRSSHTVIGEKVVCSTLASYTPPQSCFHPSDMFFFGRREDVLDMWDIPLAPEPETTHWFLNNPLPAGAGPNSPKLRYDTEQYIWLSFLRKYRAIDFDSLWDVRPATIAESEAYLASNLILVSPKQAGILPLKHATFAAQGLIGHIRLGCYDHLHWKALYYRHCRPGSPNPLGWFPAVYDMTRAALEWRLARKRAAA